MRLAAVTALAALALAPAAAAQPNVLLINTDDQRWDTLEYMPTVTSELVGKGVTFSNSFVVNAVCCPSRASLLTGRWSHSTGVWGIKGPHGGFHVFDDRSTLPVWLNDVGYETMLAGKYLNGYLDGAYVPPGWDRWFAHTRNENAYFGWGASEDGTAVEFGSEPGDYATDVLASRAVDFIHDTAGEPFFLYFAPKAPHYDVPGSVTPAPRHAGAYPDLPAWRPPNLNERWVGDKPDYVRSRPRIPLDRIAEFRQDQLESLLAVDEAIAAMLAALRETGELADTLIIFTSDNGYGWGEHRRMNKVAPYEESIRVPLVIRWDALGIPARTSPQLVLNVDLAETIAAAAGIAVPTEGRNLLPLILDARRGWRTSFLVESDMWPDMRVPAYCAFRSSGWKYVQYATGEEELYNLCRDPYEVGNIGLKRLRLLTMKFRRRVQLSACRPPHFRPLPNCTMMGTRRSDSIRGSRKRDWICAGRGRDRINVRRGGRDVVRCGSGFDRVWADKRDVLYRCEQRSRRRIP
ncbi:MAG: sulfatase family protein, partial [Thermoleophilaceae bacterium]